VDLFFLLCFFQSLESPTQNGALFFEHFGCFPVSCAAFPGPLQCVSPHRTNPRETCFFGHLLRRPLSLCKHAVPGSPPLQRARRSRLLYDFHSAPLLTPLPPFSISHPSKYASLLSSSFCLRGNFSGALSGTSRYPDPSSSFPHFFALLLNAIRM